MSVGEPWWRKPPEPRPEENAIGLKWRLRTWGTGPGTYALCHEALQEIERLENLLAAAQQHIKELTR